MGVSRSLPRTRESTVGPASPRDAGSLILRRQGRRHYPRIVVRGDAVIPQIGQRLWQFLRKCCSRNVEAASTRGAKDVRSSSVRGRAGAHVRGTNVSSIFMLRCSSLAM